MSLEAGHQLAHYEILELVGKGGMGEVYRARDTKLGRDVAIKVLPEPFAQDQERLSRFQREAQLLAQLNHPNIATLHGLEEQDGEQFLVMEFVEGETLAERIAKGPIPVDEAIPLFIQIAEGLEAAHEKRIIHRDLKPANTKIGSDGIVKILDFGLAKALAAKETLALDSSQSPTLTKGTAHGTIMGTASYMSPEQARGKTVDKRTDIWAFGCCLFEALSGARAYGGDNATDILAAVVKSEPDFGRLPPSTPWRVRDVLGRCLRKDLRRRFGHIGDVRIELEEARPSMPAETVPVNNASRTLAMTIVAAAVTALAFWAALRGPSPRPILVSRWSISLPRDSTLPGVLDVNTAQSVAISPDGRHIAYIVERDGTTQLHLRAADKLRAEAVDGGAGATMPFFSPDSQSLGFSTASGTLMRVSVRGGAPVAITEVGRNVRGASWGSDGFIVFNPGTSSGLYRVSADGGEPALLAAPRREAGEKAYRSAEVLPGANAVVFTIVTNAIESFDDASIALLSLETGEVRILIEGGSSARYSSSGHLVYARAGALLAVPFDPGSLAVTGAPVRVLEGVTTWPTMGSAVFSLSREGSLVYAPGPPLGIDSRVVWVDRTGAATPLVNQARPFLDPRLSPDGRALALSVNDVNMSLWVYDIGRGALTRIVSGTNNWRPIWTPDGKQLTFSSDREGALSVFSTAADGSSEVRRLVGGELEQIPESWTPDARTLAYNQLSEDTGYDIGLLSADRGEPQPFLKSTANEKRAAFSPNGRWMAYESDESGRPEIYLCAFPDPGAKQQLSIDGGTDPRWNSDGRELFYRNGTQMMAVRIQTEGSLTFAAPQLLFDSDAYNTYESSYDVSTDGERFVMIDVSKSASPPEELVVVQNWHQELERLVPTNK